MKIGKIVALLAAVALLPALAGCLVRSETLTAMLAAADALRNGNYAEFEKHVDVDALIGNVVDLTFSQVNTQVAKQYGGVLKSVEPLAKSLMVSQTKNEFKRLVNKGEITKLAPELKQLPSAALLIGVVNLFGVPQNTDNYQVLDVKKTGNVENLKMNVRGSKSEPWLALHIQSEKVGGTYRINRIANLDQIYANVLKTVIP
jgi:hypothetical protein